MDCSYFVTPTIDTIFNCTLSGLGIPFEFAVLGILAIFILVAAVARLGFDFSLAGALTLTVSLMWIAGPTGSVPLLQYLVVILLLGVGLRILTAGLRVFQQ
jgi:hypothetical protein